MSQLFVDTGFCSVSQSFPYIGHVTEFSWPPHILADFSSARQTTSPLSPPRTTYQYWLQLTYGVGSSRRPPTGLAAPGPHVTRSPSGTVPRPADCPLPGSGSHVRKVKHYLAGGRLYYLLWATFRVYVVKAPPATIHFEPEASTRTRRPIVYITSEHYRGYASLSNSKTSGKVRAGRAAQAVADRIQAWQLFRKFTIDVLGEDLAIPPAS
ncbi:hypothetical protein Bbelb_159780 [Branchiostoma belcheri]|nr:hypothetical protein Bbelb_159780 [Branchiostoma belcheri]